MAGLEALAAIFGGLGQGAGSGYESGVDAAIKQRALEEQARQFNEGNFTPAKELPFLQGILPPGVEKVRNTNMPAYMGEFAKQEAQRVANEKAANVGTALESFPASTKDFSSYYGKPPVDQEIAGLGPIARGGSPDKAIDALRDILKARTMAAMPSLHPIQMEDENGNPIWGSMQTPKGGGTPTVITTPAAAIPNRNATDQAFKKWQANPTPENLQHFNAVAQQVNAPGGSTTLPKSAAAGMGASAPGGTTELAPGVTRSPSGAIQANTLPNDAEIEKGGGRIYMVRTLDDVASKADDMSQLLDSKNRASLNIRGFIQGHTTFQTLTPEEQKWVTLHENLRTQLINLETGLGSFRSPEMQAKFEQIIGRYWSPGTSERIRELRDMVRAQGQGVADASKQVRKTPIEMPPASEDKPAKPPVEQHTGGEWTDMGNGVRVRIKR